MLAPKTWMDPSSHYLNAIGSDWYRSIIMLQNALSVYTTKFYMKKDYITLHLPVTTGSISSPIGMGSDSLPVEVELQGVRTYLADSMQFMLEYGCRFHPKGCYYLMPSFRGEKADERHLCQFYHSEAEIEGDLDDVMALVEEYIVFLSRELLKNNLKDIEMLGRGISHIEKIAQNENSFAKISFDEAVTLLRSVAGSDFDKCIEFHDQWRNITLTGEKILMQQFEGPVWVTHYDALAVPFYQKITNDGKALNADLLMGIGETVGCGERHKDVSTLKAALDLHNVSQKEYEWYIRMKEHYPLQTAGFGMGVERFLMWLIKADDIRDMQVCPRFNGQNIVP